MTAPSPVCTPGLLVEGRAVIFALSLWASAALGRQFLLNSLGLFRKLPRQPTHIYIEGQVELRSCRNMSFTHGASTSNMHTHHPTICARKPRSPSCPTAVVRGLPSTGYSPGRLLSSLFFHSPARAVLRAVFIHRHTGKQKRDGKKVFPSTILTLAFHWRLVLPKWGMTRSTVPHRSDHKKSRKKL